MRIAYTIAFVMSLELLALALPLPLPVLMLGSGLVAAAALAAASILGALAVPEFRDLERLDAAQAETQAEPATASG